VAFLEVETRRFEADDVFRFDVCFTDFDRRLPQKVSGTFI